MCPYPSAKPHSVQQNFLVPIICISWRISEGALCFCFPVLLQSTYGPGMLKGIIHSYLPTGPVLLNIGIARTPSLIGRVIGNWDQFQMTCVLWDTGKITLFSQVTIDTLCIFGVFGIQLGLWQVAVDKLIFDPVFNLSSQDNNDYSSE